MKKIITILIFSVMCIFISAPISASAASGTFDTNNLDMGIYWYGKGDVCKKAVEGQANPYFDNNKPTMILMHGWLINSTKNNNRLTFNVKNNNAGFGVDLDLADYWIDKGWNIGIFYWSQMSDESELKDAEAKIWSNNTSKSLRWKKSDGNYMTYNGSEKSVGEIFLNEYSKIMKNYNGNEVRIIGHSLGTQLAINGSKLVNDSVNSGKLSSKLKVDRVALLEPFWSKGEKSYLGGKWTGEISREYVKSLTKDNTVVEMYKSSNINDLWVGDSNNEMKKLTIFTDIYADFLGFTDQNSKHGYAKEWYIYSMAFGDVDNRISASTPTSKLKKMINSGYYYTQANGKNTFTPADDTFNKIRW